MFQFADIQQHECAERFLHDVADSADKRHRLIKRVGDEVRRVGRGNIARRKITRTASNMET
ncbi:hypothetical protein D3C80_2082380 [compost metagenome]